MKMGILPALDPHGHLPYLRSVESFRHQHPHAVIAWRPIHAQESVALPYDDVRRALLPCEVAPEQGAPPDVLVKVEEVVLLVP